MSAQFVSKLVAVALVAATFTPVAAMAEGRDPAYAAARAAGVPITPR
jgi:hypothetical protein